MTRRPVCIALCAHVYIGVGTRVAIPGHRGCLRYDNSVDTPHVIRAACVFPRRTFPNE